MRVSLRVLASAGVAAVCAATPSIAAAASHPHATRGLTIHATPSHIIAGDPVLIFGHLAGPKNANRKIVLYHRVGLQKRFTVVSHTRTNASGKYFFPRAQYVVNDNRSWFVRGPNHSHSTTVHEKVAAEVTLSSDTASGTTRHAITFKGQITPAHGVKVALQEQTAAGNSWRTIGSTQVGAGGRFSINYAWRRPGPHTVRIRFPGDALNTPASSNPTAVVVNQRQAPYFTIQSSDLLLTDGAAATISGVLDKPHTSVGQGGVTIGLFARAPQSDAKFTQLATTTTAADGSYGFTVGGTTNELYQARVIGKKRHSAILFQGVQDAVTIAPSATSSTVGGQVTFSGSVAPDNAGHPVLLEYIGHDGQWQVAATSTVLPNSTYSIPWTFGNPGAHQFRVRVAGGPDNVGGTSAPVTITVAAPTLSSLPSS
ncbi:MAG TPA: Ig-like domain-containing protein [Solirubrobacteraceae bacterium]|nr:Ig-like domain-containing protein [Solirubrobacteraceae bacterium]